jgi:hypothetical protein
MLLQLLVNNFWFTTSLYFGKSIPDTKKAMELLEEKLDSGHYKASEHSPQVHRCFEYYLENKETLCLIP